MISTSNRSIGKKESFGQREGRTWPLCAQPSQGPALLTWMVRDSRNPSIWAGGGPTPQLLQKAAAQEMIALSGGSLQDFLGTVRPRPPDPSLQMAEWGGLSWLCVSSSPKIGVLILSDSPPAPCLST